MNESAEIHDAREHNRLVRFMTRKGRRFGLALARYEDTEVAKAQRALADEQASASNIRVTTIRLADFEDDVLGQLAAASATNDVVHVIGLDDIAVDRTGRRMATRSLLSLNLRRDDLPQAVVARVVVWIAAEAYPQFAKLAWDLLDVMLTRFEFRDERAPKMRRSWNRELRVYTPPVYASEQAAKAHARAAAETSDVVMRADESALAGHHYAQVGQLDRAIEHLERASALYERVLTEHLYSVVLAVNARRQFAKALWRHREPQRAREEIVRALSLADSALEDTDAPWPDRWTLEEERLFCLWTQHVFDNDVAPESSATASTLADLELLRRWRGTDPDALRTLFARHLATVVRFLELLAPNQVGETSVVGCFTSLLSLPEVDDASDFRALLFDAARRVARKDHTPPATPHIGSRNPALQATLEQLQADAAELIELHYIFGVPVGELAEMFGVVEPTLQYRMDKAVRRLLDGHAKRAGAQLSEPDLRAAFARASPEDEGQRIRATTRSGR